MNERLRRKIQRIKERKPNHPNISKKKFDRYYDWLVCYIIFDSNNRIKENWIRQIKKRCPNILEYINNRYSNSLSINETCYRMLYHIENRPKCKICGKDVQYTGIGNYLTYCSIKCQANSNIVKKRRNETNFKRYGTIKPQQSNIIKEKIKNTCLKKYGTTSYLTTNNCKNIRIEKYGTAYPLQNKDILEKTKQTCIEKYGTDNPAKFGTEYFKSAMILKYNVDSYSKTDRFKKIMFDKKDIINQKRNNTKQKNHTFNISKQEEETYNILKGKYSDVIRQYNSKEYPYNCDFYIPSKNLYIECNYHWTHGRHPYNKENDKETLEKWKLSSTKYFLNAIHTWTIRDVEKRNKAKENNLNYIEIFEYNMDKLLNLIKKY